jgi:flagellar basal-body rod protein FlgG
MDQELYEVASKALVQEMRLEVLANNMANINTVGFKEDRIFQIADSLAPLDSQTGTVLVGGQVEIAPASLPVATFTNFSPGTLKPTGNALDFALEGNGFFCIETASGTQYTRKGNFGLDPSGVLVTQDGLPVLGMGGQITIEGSEVTVDRQGDIYVDGNRVDTLKVVDFPQPYPLVKTVDTLFAPDNSAVPETVAENPGVAQGFVEMANLDVVKMMTEMIEVLRGYEAYQKVIQSINDINATTIKEVGTVI